MTGSEERNSSKKAILEYEENNGDYNNRDTSPEVSFIKDKSRKYTVDSGIKQTKFSKLMVLLVLISLLLFIGIILLIVSRIQLDNCEESRKLKTETCDDSSNKNFTDFCTYSSEAKRVGLGKFLDKVKEAYHEVFPEEIAFHPDSSKEMIREKFRVHNPRPENIKRLSDRADELYEEAVSLVSYFSFFSFVYVQSFWIRTMITLFIKNYNSLSTIRLKFGLEFDFLNDIVIFLHTIYFFLKMSYHLETINLHL